MTEQSDINWCPICGFEFAHDATARCINGPWKGERLALSEGFKLGVALPMNVKGETGRYVLAQDSVTMVAVWVDQDAGVSEVKQTVRDLHDDEAAEALGHE